MRVHKTQSPLAGRTLRVKESARHHLYSDFGGAQILIVDWFDRVFGKTFGECRVGPIEALVYGARWARYLAGYVPPHMENELLIGTICGSRHVVHISELELPETDPPSPLPMAA